MGIPRLLLASVLLTGACGERATPQPGDAPQSAPPSQPPRAPEEPGDDAPEGSLRFTGLVQRVELEGGFWGIVSDDGKRYNPQNLPAAMQRDGQRVRVVGEPVDVMTTRMWGTPLRIVEIEPLDAQP